MTRECIDVPPVLLGILAMVRLGACQAKDPLLQNWISAIPERQSETQALFDVAEPRETVLAPAVCSGPGVIVGEVVPRLAVGTVVLADGAPLPLTDVRAPDVPVAGLP